MTFTSITRSLCKAGKAIKDHSNYILMALSSGLAIGSTIYAVKQTPKAMKALDEAKAESECDLSFIEKAKVVAPHYILPAGMLIGSVACNTGAAIVTRKQKASLAAAALLIEESYRRYREKVNELYGENMDAAIIEQEIKDNTVVCRRSDDVFLFYDSLREAAEPGKGYFEAAKEDVLTAEYELNRLYVLRGYASLNDFYKYLGISTVKGGDSLLWTVDFGTDDGYSWIDFDHTMSSVKDANTGDQIECYILTYPFEPAVDFVSF